MIVSREWLKYAPDAGPGRGPAVESRADRRRVGIDRGLEVEVRHDLDIAVTGDPGLDEEGPPSAGGGLGFEVPMEDVVPVV